MMMKAALENQGLAQFPARARFGQRWFGARDGVHRECGQI